MNTKEYESWRSKNDHNGYSSSVDEYNRSFKKERPDQPEEYAIRGLEEYHNYPDMKDLRKESDDKKDKSKQEQQSKDSNKSKNSGSRSVGNIAARVVAVAVGAVVVASSYQAMGGELPFELPFSFIQDNENNQQQTDPNQGTTPGSDTYSESWRWSEDHKRATLVITNNKGVVIKEVAAVVKVEEKSASCSEEGSKTYTATASYNKKSYTNSYSSTTSPALGHTFGEGKMVYLDDGTIMMVYECSLCHEQLTISTTIEENE